VQTQIRNLAQLLEEVTAVIGSGLAEQPMRRRDVDLDQLCRVCLRDIETTIGAGHTLRLRNSEGVSLVNTDEALVNRILINLLSNAVKYAPAGGEVELTLERRDEHLILQVMDHGIGIPASDLGRIFEPFYRAPNAADYEGTGLGLSIVNECVKRLGGSIEVRSVPGEGTVFIVRLPLS
jgi:signal transduction histidine kinase